VTRGKIVSNTHIRTGEALSAVSVLLLLVGLLALWRYDHSLKEWQHADRIRHNAAALGAKVERWPDLEDRYFEDLEPLLVDVSEKVEQTHSTEPANRILYKGLADAKGRSSQRWLDEQWEQPVAKLIVDVPEMQPVLRQALGSVKYTEEKMYGDLSVSLQAALRDESVLKLKQSPEIGNVLRMKVAEKRSEFLPRVRDIAEPLRQELKTVLDMTDADLLDGGERVRMLAPLK